MGCASSKQSKKHQRCRNCQTPMPRSYSMHVIHPPQQKGDNFHLVALTSTTLGSLQLDDHDHHPPSSNSHEEFSMGLIEAKTWSKMIEEKIPKMPTPKTPNMITPPGEPETINTWELMEGLEELDVSPCRFANHIRSFSFDVVDHIKPKLEVEEEEEAKKGKSGELSDHPNIISVFRKEYRVVVYFTSLRGVRKTYEDSCHVRSILKGLGVRVDERDVSMHSGFKDELRQLLGGGGGFISLPRVFIGNKYIGGADEIRQMHEEGRLEKAVEGCQKDDEVICEACGDVRFVPCETCSGSCKIYYEDDTEEVEEVDCGFQRCPDCNENGLIRCPICCDL